MSISGTDASSGYACVPQPHDSSMTALTRASRVDGSNATAYATAEPREPPSTPTELTRNSFETCVMTKRTSPGMFTTSAPFGPPGVSAFVNGNVGAAAMKPAAAHGWRYGSSACAPNPCRYTSNGSVASASAFFGYSMIVWSLRPGLRDVSTNVSTRLPTW